MKTSNSLVLLLIAVFFFSCDKGDNRNPLDFQLGQSFELAFGNAADCTCDNLSITFADVLEDSRCPSDVVCVWEGQAVVQLELQMPGGRDTIELASRAGNEELSRDTLNGFVFELLEVSPYPVSTNQIDDEDYRIELLVKDVE